VFAALASSNQSSTEETSSLHTRGITTACAAGKVSRGACVSRESSFRSWCCSFPQHSVYNNDFTAIARHMPGRSRESLREQWVERLSPCVKVLPWSPEEDEVLFHAVQRCGRTCLACVSIPWELVGCSVQTRRWQVVKDQQRCARQDGCSMPKTLAEFSC
jgi:Myb-like DNA-binding domain